MNDSRTRFTELLSSDDFSLAEAGLLIAAECYPELDVAAYLHRFDVMAGEARTMLPINGEIRQHLSALNRYLFDHVGLVGNQLEYYDPRNSFLNEVLDRRMGIPITISVVYLEVAWRLDLPLFGVGMPGHFILGCPDDQGERVLIDAFHRGREVSEVDCAETIRRIYGAALPFQPGLLEPASRRSIVIRMLGNLRVISGQRLDHEESLRWSELTVIASGASARSLRERGAVRIALGDLDGAEEDLRSAFERANTRDERREAELLLASIARHRLRR